MQNYVKGGLGRDHVIDLGRH